MKKLLSILASVTLIASGSAPVVSCSIGKSVDESIDPVLEQQNFNVITDIAKSGKSVEQYLIGNGTKESAQQSLFFSNGIDGYNKYIGNRSSDLTGSFGASKWTFIDMLNEKFKLGLKRNATAKANSSTVKTQKDLVSNIDWNIDKFDELDKIKVTGVTASYQEKGNPPVTDDSENTITAFNKIVELGDMSSKLFDDQKLTQLTDDNSEWNKQLSFLKSSEFTNRTYTKYTTFEYDDGSAKKQTFTFTQIIMLTNTGVINEEPAKGSSDKNMPIDNKVNSYLNAYNKLDAATKANISKDDYMNLMFSKMNIFTAQHQDYSVSVNLDTNNLNAQLDTSESGINQLLNNRFNSINEKQISDFFIPELEKIKEDTPTENPSAQSFADKPTLDAQAKTKDNQTFTIGTTNIADNDNIMDKVKIDGLPEGITVVSVSVKENIMTIKLSAPIAQTDAEQDFTVAYTDGGSTLHSELVVSANDTDIQSIDSEKIWKEFVQTPRTGASQSYVSGQYIDNVLVPWIQRHSDNAGNIGSNNLDIDITNLDEKNDLTATSEVTVTVKDYKFLKGSYTLKVATDNLSSLQTASNLKSQLQLGSAGSGTLSSNDFIFKTFGINDQSVKIDDLLNEWLENDSTYEVSGSIYKIKTTPVTATGTDLENILTKMADLANKTNFTSKLNVADDTVTTFNLDLTSSEFKKWNGKTVTFKIANKDLQDNQ